MIALNSIVCCIAGVLFPIIWNKYSKLYNTYGYLLFAEIIGYVIIGFLICTGLISNLSYYLLDTFLFVLITRNIICGGNKLRSMRYDQETREKYDNNSNIVANFSSLLGFGISFLVTIPSGVAFVLITIGICIDNIFYYHAYKKSLSMISD